MLYKDYTSNRISTLFFASKIALPSNLLAQLAEWYKNWCRDGIPCVAFVAMAVMITN